MHNNQEKGPIMSRRLSMRGCRSFKGRLIERVGGLLMALTDLLMEMVYKPLVEVHIK